MSKRAKKLKMNMEQRNLIFGYTREKEKFYKCNIPEAITRLFALYYVSNPEWDLSILSDDINVSGQDSEYVENTIDDIDDWKSIFGKRICKGYGKYVWNIEIVESAITTENTWNIMVGIIKNDSEFCDRRKDGSAFGEHTSIGIVGSTNGIVEYDIEDENYGEEFDQIGDTVQITLDLDDLTLSYIINGNDYGIAIKGGDEKYDKFCFDLNKNDEYRFALSLIAGYKVRLF